MYGTYWACPGCCGTFFDPPDRERTLCVVCGKTLDEWTRQFPEQSVGQYPMYPDDRYRHGTFLTDDPS